MIALSKLQKGVLLMKKLVLVAFLLFGLSTVAMAQDVSVADVFGGYSFFRCDRDTIGCDLHGWDAAVDFNFNKNWAVTIDVSALYGTVDSDARTDIKYHTVFGGPKYTFGSSERVRPYVHALFGVNHINPEKNYPALTVENNLAIAMGGGVDVKVTDRISIRAAQVDYLMIRRFSEYDNNFRCATGIVFRFGSR